MAIVALHSFPDTPLPERQQAMSASTVGREFSEFLDDTTRPPRQVAAGNMMSSESAVSRGGNDNITASATVSAPSSSPSAPAQSSHDDGHLVHVLSSGQVFSGDDVAETARQSIGEDTQAAIPAQASHTQAATDPRAFLHTRSRSAEHAVVAARVKPRSSKVTSIAEEAAEPDAAATVPRSAVATHPLPASTKTSAFRTGTKMPAPKTMMRTLTDDAKIASDASKTLGAERACVEGGYATPRRVEALAGPRATPVEVVSRSASPPAGYEVSIEALSHQMANGSSGLAWRHGVEWSTDLAVVPDQLPVAQRIFGFTSLGMFGAPTAGGGAAMAVACRIASQKTGETADDGLASISGSAAADSVAAVSALSGSLSTAISAPVSEGGVVTSADRPVAVPLRGALINPSANLAEMVAAESDDAGAPAEASAGLTTPAAPEKREIPSANLVVAGPNDGLMVAARGVGETGTDVAALRQMLDAVAAEFDMHIGEFHWNGSSAQTSANRGRNA